MSITELINQIISEWAYRVNDGMPDAKNPTHLKELGIVLREMNLYHIKDELIENLLTEKGKTPEKIKEADKNFTNPILNKEIPYKAADGSTKKGIVGNLLRLPKDSEGRKAAEKLMPPEGSDERDSAMKDLGSEKDGKSTGGDKEKGKEDEKGKEGSGEEEKAKAAQSMFDPKADPAMAARMDREKEANAKLAQKDKEADSEQNKEVGSDTDSKETTDKFTPIEPQDVQLEMPQADPDTFGGGSDIPDGVPPADLEKFNTDINKVAKEVQRAKEKGEPAPNINLCDVTIPGTNLYCDDNLGIPRDEMPQFKGTAQPGSRAAGMEVDASGEVDTEPVFKEMLKEKGIKTLQTEVPADKLKATQKDLVGAKVVGMMGALEKDPNHPKITAPIYVSRDGYVIDGHHRWAAIVAYNAQNPDKQIPMKTTVLDQDIKDAIPMANKFAEDMGIASKKADANKEAPSTPTSVGKNGITDKIKTKIQNWTAKEKAFFERNEGAPGSDMRRSLGETLKSKAAGVWKAIKKGAKHEVEEFKTAGEGVGKFFKGEKLSDHEKKALKAVAIKVATTAIFGAAGGGLHHGAVAFGKHVAMEFIPHVVGETILKGAGRAALFADMEGEAEMDANMAKFAEMVAKGLEDMEITPEMMEQMVDSYNKKKEEEPQKEMTEENLQLAHELMLEMIYGFISEATTTTGDWKLAARKGGPEGKIVYFKSPEAKKDALAAGTHIDVDKELQAKGEQPKNEPVAGADLFGQDYKDARVDTPTNPTGKKKKEKEFPKGYIAPTIKPSQVKEGLDNGDLTALTECNDNLLHNRDIGVAGMGGPVASYGEAGLCRTANTLREKGYEGFVDDNIETVNAKMQQIKEKKPRFQKAINTVAIQLGYELPKDEELAIQYLGARLAFSEQEFQRLSSNPDSIWTKEGKQGFGQDRDAFDAWAKAIFDGALSTKSLIENESLIDTTKPYVVIQSNTVEGEGHDEGILNHLKDRLEKAKESGNKEDIQHYSEEIDAFTKLGFHDTMAVGFDKKGRTCVFSITNKKQDDLADIWGNTTPAYMLNIIKKQFDPKVAIKVIKVIDAGIADVSDAKMATNREFANFKLDTNFIKVLETPELKKYTTALKTEKKFNAWLKEKMGKKYPPKNLQLYVAGAQQYVQSQIDAGENPSYEKFGKLLTKVGELGQNPKYIRKYKDSIKFNSDGIQAAVENKNSEKELTAKVHKNVVRAIESADKALKTWPGKETGVNGPHKQAYVTTVIHSMHLDLMITNYDKRLGAITGIRGTTSADFRNCMSELSGFTANPKKSEAENRAALNKHLVERCTLDPVSHAILIKNGKGTVTLAEDTWRTAGTSQKVEKKLGDGLRGCVASKADARQKSNRQAGK